MSKWYEVTVQATKMVAVEIADDSERDPEDEAQEIARDEAFSFCDDIETLEIRLLETQAQINSVLRHADEVCSLPNDQEA